MITYPDGQPAQVGDRLALAHRQHTGVVVEVIETADQLSNWGLKDPGLMIDTSYGGLVFEPTFTFSPEEIALVARGPKLGQ